MVNNIYLKIAPFFEVMWKKNGRAFQAPDDIKTLRMRFARWITKATDTNSEYVALIAFPP